MWNGYGFAPTWLRQVSIPHPLLHMTTLTTAQICKCFDIGLQVDGQCLQQTERFIYLGGTISSKEGSEADVSRRIGIARGIFHALSKVWTSKDIKKSTKIEVLRYYSLEFTPQQL